jgi:hypothetical protein
MDTLTPCRSRRPSINGRDITLAARQLRDSRVNRFIDQRDKSAATMEASTTPVPRKTPKEKATRSSEKETPTVVGTQGPLVLGHDDELDATTNAASVTSRHRSAADASISTGTNSSDGSSEEMEKDVQAQATMMLQTTLECGIASICRLRKLYPTSFFKKSDLEGTSVTQFDVEYLENMLACDNTQDESMKGEFGGGTLSPLTATQKTQNTTQYTECGRGLGRESNTQRDVSGDAKAATEALILIRWIGKQGVNVLMKNDQLASVHFGIMLPTDEEACDELLEQYVVSYPVFFSSMCASK